MDVKILVLVPRTNTLNVNVTEGVGTGLDDELASVFFGSVLSKGGFPTIRRTNRASMRRMRAIETLDRWSGLHGWRYHSEGGRAAQNIQLFVEKDSILVVELNVVFLNMLLEVILRTTETNFAVGAYEHPLHDVESEVKAIEEIRRS